jgi:hypothetical protein
MPIVPTPTQHSELSEDERRDYMRHDVGKARQSVRTPTQDSEYNDEVRDATRHNAENPTPSVTTLIVPTLTQKSESSEEEPRYAIRHDSGIQTPNISR